jgi:DNA sulfur modification protein DndB
LLGKLYKSKKSADYKISVDHNLVSDYEKEGWTLDTVLKTKTKLTKEKTHSKKFEDAVWCQFYELGFRTLNIDETFELPFSKDPKDKKQIDVIAINDETAIIIECKSSEKLKKAPSYKDEFDLLGLRLDGFTKVLKQLFNNTIRTKFIFATNNLRIDPESVDMQRFFSTNSYHHNDSSFQYVDSIIKNYKNAATYQFMGLLFKNQLINSEKIEIPAVEGDMGGLKYFMFSIEPGILLKMGFVLHRTKANEEEIRESIGYGVIKMNIDTDMQFAFTEGIRDYMQGKAAYVATQIGNPDGADQPNKKHYDPRKWLREGEETFKTRLKQAFQDLNNVDTL